MKDVTRWLLATYENRPYLTPVLIVALWSAYGIALLTPYVPFPKVVHTTQLSDLYIGAASVSALVAGFAGVVITFVYSASGDRFRRFRVAASPSLSANWRSVILLSFGGAAASFSAAIIDMLVRGDVAWWVFLLGAAFTCDAMLRVVRQFFVMLRLVTADDISETRRNSTL